MLLVSEANWICNFKRKNYSWGRCCWCFSILGRTGFPVRLKFPVCVSRGGALMWGLITAHLSGSVYSGLGETFWTANLLFSVCSLHSITQESSPRGGSPCTLLKVTIVAAQHLWFGGCCQFYANAPVCAFFVSLRLYSDTDMKTLKQQRCLGGCCEYWAVDNALQILPLILNMKLPSFARWVRLMSLPSHHSVIHRWGEGEDFLFLILSPVKCINWDSRNHFALAVVVFLA